VDVVSRANDWLSHPNGGKPLSTTSESNRTTRTPDQTSSIGSPHIFPKSEEAWKTEFFQRHATEALDHFIRYKRAEFIERLYVNISNTESPLEAAFVAAWMAIEECDFSTITFRTQHAVEVEGRGYRLDFVFEPQQYGGLEALIGPQCPKIALELDGHDYHEKTKEQVTYRNRRDRDLQAAGWIVLHISGSEFNANAEKATKEVYDRVSTLLWAAYHAMNNK
jgi:very-short-patch-repair endonuclease